MSSSQGWIIDNGLLTFIAIFNNIISISRQAF